jgi:light-regulated signal transduction histidine kinase (bacteriophytochrome)
MKIPSFIKSEQKQRQSRARNLRNLNAALPYLQQQQQQQLQKPMIVIDDFTGFQPQKPKDLINQKSEQLIQKINKTPQPQPPPLTSMPVFSFKSVELKSTPVTTAPGRFTKSINLSSSTSSSTSTGAPKRLQRNRKGVSAKPSNYCLRSDVIQNLIKNEIEQSSNKSNIINIKTPATITRKANDYTTPIRSTSAQLDKTEATPKVYSFSFSSFFFIRIYY